MTLRELTAELKTGGIENADGEARILFCHFSAMTPAQLAGQNPSLNSADLKDALQRRLMREPLQYILGQADFFRETYLVSKDCLIPRSDTELLVETAIEILPHEACFADLCTGSGCIVISTLANRTDLHAHAYDVSEKALQLAKENAIRNKVAERIDFHLSDILRQPPTEAVFDAILSNPPYIRSDVIDTLSPEVTFEPRIALDGGQNGMTFYQAILDFSPSCLKKDGFILFEIGYDQSADITALAMRYGFQCDILKDLGGNPRVAYLKKDPRSI